jgi:hypothetical protein
MDPRSLELLGITAVAGMSAIAAFMHGQEAFAAFFAATFAFAANRLIRQP